MKKFLLNFMAAVALLSTIVLPISCTERLPEEKVQFKLAVEYITGSRDTLYYILPKNTEFDIGISTVGTYSLYHRRSTDFTQEILKRGVFSFKILNKYEVKHP